MSVFEISQSAVGFYIIVLETSSGGATMTTLNFRGGDRAQQTWTVPDSYLGVEDVYAAPTGLRAA